MATPKPKRLPVADKVRRQARVRELYLSGGLTVDEILPTLRAEKLIRTRKNDSAKRLIRADLAEIDAGIKESQLADLSAVAKARYIERQELIFRASLEEFHRIEGETHVETVIDYGKGKPKMRSTTRKRADRGPLRIRALALAREASEKIALAQGATTSESGSSAGAGEEDAPSPFGARVKGLEDLPAVARLAKLERLLAEATREGGTRYDMSWLLPLWGRTRAEIGETLSEADRAAVRLAQKATPRLVFIQDGAETLEELVEMNLDNGRVDA